MAEINNNLPETLHNKAGSVAPQRPTDFLGIQRLLSNVPYWDKEQISSYEQQVYNLLKPNPQNLDGLAVFLRIQLMLGNHQKAAAVANRIWDIGGALNYLSEKSFINDLINLGLLEMASILLRPYFEDMKGRISEYGHLFLKYAIASGSLNVLEKIAVLLPSPQIRKALVDFVAVYRHLNYVDCFKSIQRTVIENVKDTLCAYEFNIYTDRGFTDLEIMLYVGAETPDSERLHEFLDLQTTAICTAKGRKKLNNLSFVVRPISQYINPAVWKRQE